MIKIINQNIPDNLKHPLLLHKKTPVILDYRDRPRFYSTTNQNFIPQVFPKYYFYNYDLPIYEEVIVFRSFNSFQQNYKSLGHKIRKYVFYILYTYTLGARLCKKTDSLKVAARPESSSREDREDREESSTMINSIGGESYLFGSKNNTVFYTNSYNNYSDAIQNNYNKENINYVDYNSCQLILKHDFTVINLSSLNSSLLKQINTISENILTTKLIIINCHHTDFWKKIKLLSNFTLITRKQFCNKNNFITVNFLVRKNFIPLGGNCSVSYNLNKLKLRSVSYPFDWSSINLSNLVNVITNDFHKFDEIELVKYSENHNSYIVKNNYCKFAHEVLYSPDNKPHNENSLADILYRNIQLKLSFEIFKKKLQKRIFLFKQILDNKDEFKIFVRLETFNYKNNEIYTNYILDLINYLEFNKKLKFKFILISKINPLSFSNSILLKNRLIWKNFNNYFQIFTDWRFTHKFWKDILFSL